MGGGLRYFGGALGFGFVAVWIMWSLAAALLCLLAAAVGYGAVVLGELGLAKRAAAASNRGISPGTRSSPRRTAEGEALSRQADELNQDLGHVYEPGAATSAQAGARTSPVGDDSGG